MPLIFYRCSKCKREFSKSIDALQCEEAHLTVTEARVTGYGIYKYPYEITVTFNNGQTHSYVAANQQ